MIALTVEILLAISNIQWLIYLGMIVMGATSALFGPNIHRKVKLVPGLLLVFAFFAIMLFLIVMNARGCFSDSLALKLRPGYDSVMIGMWGIGMLFCYRKRRSSRSQGQP